MPGDVTGDHRDNASRQPRLQSAVPERPDVRDFARFLRLFLNNRSYPFHNLVPSSRLHQVAARPLMQAVSQPGRLHPVWGIEKQIPLVGGCANGYPLLQSPTNEDYVAEVVGIFLESSGQTC